MAVGKGSMERAAKTAKTAKKTPASVKKATAEAVAAESVAAAEIIASPSGEVLQQIVYQASEGMLERDAKPNEIFGLGDAMPVYYF